MTKGFPEETQTPDDVVKTARVALNEHILMMSTAFSSSAGRTSRYLSRVQGVTTGVATKTMRNGLSRLINTVTDAQTIETDIYSPEHGQFVINEKLSTALLS
ncbi:hypothetical protein BD410DRAFT_804812 [Rickenella mellea]|uniref:Uncharacterized protein n=1 Tax=Rickenella mellea TaxID=50990 RepID=A0A4Y7PZ50_9AGAM|nr:hypothetical protein BD410DRAFT_804812 [Rickenella mellea]